MVHGEMCILECTSPGRGEEEPQESVESRLRGEGELGFRSTVGTPYLHTCILSVEVFCPDPCLPLVFKTAPEFIRIVRGWLFLFLFFRVKKMKTFNIGMGFKSMCQVPRAQKRLG